VQARLADQDARAVEHQSPAAQAGQPRLLVGQPDERGVAAMPSAPGARIGPPAAIVYALDPIGVATTTPSPASAT